MTVTKRSLALLASISRIRSATAKSTLSRTCLAADCVSRAVSLAMHCSTVASTAARESATLLAGSAHPVPRSVGSHDGCVSTHASRSATRHHRALRSSHAKPLSHCNALAAICSLVPNAVSRSMHRTRRSRSSATTRAPLRRGTQSLQRRWVSIHLRRQRPPRTNTRRSHTMPCPATASFATSWKRHSTTLSDRLERV